MKIFIFAFTGIIKVIKTERNFQIHILAALIVSLAGIYFNIRSDEWLFIILVISLVLFAEMINTAIESLCDHVSPDYHKTIKTVKDISAGAVLITAFGAIIIGGIIFIPKLLERLNF